jgi:hypothetical protein
MLGDGLGTIGPPHCRQQVPAGTDSRENSRRQPHFGQANQAVLEATSVTAILCRVDAVAGKSGRADRLVRSTATVRSGAAQSNLRFASEIVISVGASYRNRFFPGGQGILSLAKSHEAT